MSTHHSHLHHSAMLQLPSKQREAGAPPDTPETSSGVCVGMAGAEQTGSGVWGDGTEGES